jgi:hypothetical protein
LCIPLAATAAHANADDHETLLGLVAQAASLVRPGGARRAVDVGQLAALYETLKSAKQFPPRKQAKQNVLYRYSHARTRSKKRSTSDCFFFQSSSKYL